MTPKRDDFFIGYLGRLPAAARGPIWMFAAALLAGFVGGAFAFSAGQPDPGDGRWIRQGQRVEGVMRADPYPHIRTAPDAEHPAGRAHLLVTGVKRGVQGAARRLDGRIVQTGGQWLRRGSAEMLQVGRRIQAKQSAGPAFETPVEELGRWRLSGEICDGKCYLGIMRPGVGLAHKACANLCVKGGVPPVLVLEQPVKVDGLETVFILLADAEGKAVGDDLYDLVALLVRLEGALERHGDMLVLRTDLSRAEAL